LHLVRRPRLGRARFGEPIVEFSYPWPQGVKHLYVVSDFTAFFPGRVELRRVGDRGLAQVRVREGTYRYFYVDSYYRPYEDYEVEAREELELWKFKVRASRLEAGLRELREALREGGVHGELILHDEGWPSYFSGYGGLRVLRLFTVRGEFDEVYVRALTGDGWKEFGAERVLRDELRDYFEARVPRPDIKAYLFRLTDGRREYYFGFDGLGDAKPWSPPSLSDDIPWFLGTTYYQVFVDSFYSSRGPLPQLKERPRERLGGDLIGLAQKLDYIRGLGIEAIYLTPIYKSGSYHRYDVIDHLSVDDDLGGLEAFEQLVSRAHELGMKVILDLVPHHSSPCAREFVELLHSNDMASSFSSWYRLLENDLEGLRKIYGEVLKEYIAKGCRGSLRPQGLLPPYETFAGVWSMVKLNHENGAVLERFCHIVREWLRRGADGFRIDVAHGLPDSFMRGLYACAQESEERPVIMEIMGLASSYPLGETANSAMNYEAYGAILDFLTGKASACEAARRLSLEYLRLPLGVANAMYNLVGSHDTPRIATLLKDYGLVERAFAIEVYVFGSPSIYYGDEIGMKGDHDPDNRLPMIWDPGLWEKELQESVVSLLRLRASLKPLRIGTFEADCVNPDTLKVVREWGDERAVALVSRRRAHVEGALKELSSAGCKPMLSKGLDGPYLDGYLVATCRGLDA